MKRFPSLGYCSPQELAKSSTSHNRANQINTYFFFEKKQEKENPKERDPPQRSHGHNDSFSHSRAT